MIQAQQNPTSNFGAEDGGMPRSGASSLDNDSPDQMAPEHRGANPNNLGGISDIMDDSVEHLNTFEKLNDQI